MTGPADFDLCGPLPGPGVTVLEASAGTGKTYTIAALVTRMVAEGVATLAEVLVVTFTRMATGELRERVRQSLAEAEAALAMALAGVSPPPGKPVLALLATGPAAEVGERHRRLADALASFDAATVTTTHGFCYAVLEALGARGQVAVGAELLEDPGDLLSEVVDDLMLRHALRSGAKPLSWRRQAALDLGASKVHNPGTPLDPPANRADQDDAGLSRRFAVQVDKEVADHLFDANLLTYDGLLLRLKETLTDPERGPAACARLRQRYRAVLVDEFQDTDLVQWDVVRTAFAGTETAVVLIGDPKQAIYGFRGADVYAYLAAAAEADPSQAFTLSRNWRSDSDLLEANNVLFTPLQLGHPDIVYRPASAIQAHSRPGIKGAPVPGPLRVRLVQRSAPWVKTTVRDKLAHTVTTRQLIAEDLARDVVELLSSGAELVPREGPEGRQSAAPRPVGPGDIGVLVRTNRQVGLVQEALRSAGVAAVMAGGESVLGTPAARHWLDLLDAVQEPASRPLAVAVALGPFVGMTAAETAAASERQWEELHQLLHLWSAQLRSGGVASLYTGMSATQGLVARLLGQLDGERQLTDLGHIAEVLHGQQAREHLGPSALRAWLAERAEQPMPDGARADERSRRLDSGSDAVQVLTVHRAKGLEFPVVYCPYLWEMPRPRRSTQPVVFHDPADGSRRKLDVGGNPPSQQYLSHQKLCRQETTGEDLRLVYVALTRARHQTVLWWAPCQDAQHSALGRLLTARSLSGEVPPDGPKRMPDDKVVAAAVAGLARRGPGLIVGEVVGPPSASRWHPPASAGPGPVLAVAPFQRDLDQIWRRSSYTSITAPAHDGAALPGFSGPAVASEPEDPGTVDEPLPDGTSSGDARPGGALSGEARPSLLATMPAGPVVGTAVHEVLQRADFASLDLRGHLAELLALPEAGYPGERHGIAEVADGLATAIEAPLGPLAGGARLADLTRGDRLDELGFELPVAGGDQPWGQLLMADVARLWSEHVPPGAPLAGYGACLRTPAVVPEARGYLTGSLDLVARVQLGGTERYFVADYKTNWLGPPGEELTSWHYRPDALEAEMSRAHYPLQAIFYCVALHRYLRWRVAGYRPDEHLGGVLYLFLRGMAAAGPASATAGDLMGGTAGAAPGVFAWQPPTRLVTGLSDLLANGS